MDGSYMKSDPGVPNPLKKFCKVCELSRFPFLSYTLMLELTTSTTCTDPAATPPSGGIKPVAPIPGKSVPCCGVDDCRIRLFFFAAGSTGCLINSDPIRGFSETFRLFGFHCNSENCCLLSGHAYRLLVNV